MSVNGPGRQYASRCARARRWPHMRLAADVERLGGVNDPEGSGNLQPIGVSRIM